MTERSQGPMDSHDGYEGAEPQVSAGVTPFESRAGLDGPAAFTSSVWGVHDAQSNTDHRPSGCGYYRIVLPLDELRRHGWDTQYAAGRPPPTSGIVKLIVGERLDNPEVMGEWRRLRRNHNLIYELDDDVWSVHPTNSMAWKSYSRLSVLDAVSNCCMIADVVTVSTEPLAEVVLRESGNRNVRVLTNCIPGYLLDWERPRSKDKVVIGWSGGASHSLDLASVAGDIRKVIDTTPGVELHIVGSDFRPTLGHSSARHTRWEPDPRDFYKNLDFDIGLAPILPSEFNASKSWLKPLEYGALGIPCVATDFGPYSEYIVDGVTGFLCRRPKQWRDRIRELVADADLRESMGRKAREVAAQHTFEKNWVKWAAVYEEVLS